MIAISLVLRGGQEECSHCANQRGSLWSKQQSLSGGFTPELRTYIQFPTNSPHTVYLSGLISCAFRTKKTKKRHHSGCKHGFKTLWLKCSWVCCARATQECDHSGEDNNYVFFLLFWSGFVWQVQMAYKPLVQVICGIFGGLQDSFLRTHIHTRVHTGEMNKPFTWTCQYNQKLTVHSTQ